MAGEIVISVCCITYNQEKYIDDCINSILVQKLSYNYEIIIGDDCSTDSTREKLKEWSLKYPDKIKVIYNEKNLGPNGNILSVFNKAKGQYIAFCEGDDYWIDECKLLKQYNALKGNPDTEFCFHSAYMERDNKRLKSFSFGNVENKFYTKDVLHVVGQFAPTASYMFKRSIIDKLPAWFTECCVGDLFLELYSMKNGGIYLPEPMSVYRVNTIGSWSEVIRNDIRKFTERHLNIVKYLELAKSDFEGCTNEFNKKIANVYLNMCTRFIFDKDYSSFRKYLEKANSVTLTFTTKQKVYNKLKYIPQIIYFIHYLNSFIRN
ncbi:glycosyltransferase [Enterobacter ludwigii]|uniref:glycosyltransferase family 2 protein n=1 Tax=Enterobacter ludwigii TaxID=299767 RepID=UPI002431FEF5|nr:glycosyltransferase [Enterobacter ludwigii]WGC18860.1 glycosyltransferase [Enterobacter ludwigii]